MKKIRIHELVKKFGLSSQEIILNLRQSGFVVKSHSSSVDETQAVAVLVALIKKNISSRPTINQVQKSNSTTSTINSVGHTKNQSKSNLQESTSQNNISEEIVSEVNKSDLFAKTKVQNSIFDQNLKQLLDISKLKSKTKSLKHSSLTHNKNVEILPIQENLKPSYASNIVRTIDPNAIKARLASENRSFRPKSETKLTVDKKKNSNFKNNINTTSSTLNKKQIPKSLKKKKTNLHNQNTEKNEIRSGGSELWIKSTKKKKSINKMSGRITESIQIGAHKRVLEISNSITVNELAHKMSVKAAQVVGKLMTMGMMVTINQPIDIDTASIIANEFNYEVRNVEFVETSHIKEVMDKENDLSPRSPVVAIMGHVDHGKTSILDALRSTKIATTEIGGITQHISVYSIKTKSGFLTLLDTPGHEAFMSMRARGANITDIIVLVIAADDGVKPQTTEVILHAQKFNVPLIIAINKIDSPHAKPDRILQQLSEYKIIAEEWGGDTQFVRISATKQVGLDNLLEAINNQADIMELRANYKKDASGTIIEGSLDKGRGPIATILIQAGTLKLGDYIVTGECSGRVRAIFNSNTDKLTTATPSMAVQILGLSGVPVAGDKFNVVQDEKTAKIVTKHRSEKTRERELMNFSKGNLEALLKKTSTDKYQTIKIIIKVNASGSIEALTTSLKDLSTKSVRIEIVYSGVGNITENDVNLALVSQAIIIGFNSKPDAKANTLAHERKVNIRIYNIIYNMLDDVKLLMSNLLTPVYEENYTGRAEVRVLFPVGKSINIAGCYVLDGKISRSSRIKVKRDNKIVHSGKIAGLKRFKEDVREAISGHEFGIILENFSALHIGDILECFELKQTPARLDVALKDIQLN